MQNIFDEIKLERIRQNLKHPKEDYSPVEWLPVLVEEVGEVSKAIFENNFSNDKDNYREELIHVAAVAVRMIESFDRGNR
jgi:NTP pyrophosphatase (non-canonical NTP hydrolase)